MKKFEQVIPLSDFEVLTPSGWKEASKLIQTEEYHEYELKTDKGSTLYCADKHNIIIEDGSEHYVDELFVGMRVKTKSGVEIVSSVRPTNRKTKMYDLEVPDGHVYYTDNIASHNTTTSMAYLLHQAITRSNITIAILANKGDTAAEVLDRIKFAYESLPWYLQVGVKTWNKKSIELGNGSKIITAATSGSSIRGKSVSILYLDEFAHLDNDVEFYTSTYPVISSGKSTQVIMTSTPKGLNLFYKIWCDAIEGRNKFKTLAYDWTVVPGRNEAWRDETIANTSPVQFSQEFECSFIGSSNTLIAGWKLQQLTFKEPIESLSDKHWSVYETPKPNNSYCMTVDVSEGLGQDYAVVSIFDVTAMPYKLVAVYRNNLIQPVFLTEVAYKAGTHYNNAYALIENNSIGKIVADSLFFDFEYENLFRTTNKHGETDIGFGGHQPGIRTTTKTKALGCAQLKSLIESNSLIVEDFTAVSELSTFAVKGKSYAAEKGKTDDVVMTLVLFAWFTAQPYFSDMFDVDVRKQLRDTMDIDSNIGFMFIDDGITDYEVLDTF